MDKKGISGFVIPFELADEIVIAALQDAIRNCMSTSIPRELPVPRYQREDLINAIENCQAMNKVIKYFGGAPIDISSIEPHQEIKEGEQFEPGYDSVEKLPPAYDLRNGFGKVFSNG